MALFWGEKCQLKMNVYTYVQSIEGCFRQATVLLLKRAITDIDCVRELDLFQLIPSLKLKRPFSTRCDEVVLFKSMKLT